MKLSIIIPVYNVEKFITRCLHSCVSQNLSINEFEIVVVNDGTRDNSMKFVSQFAEEYSNISIINQENKGLSAARNRGLSVAKGDYVWFVDSDDWIENDCLAELVYKLYTENLDALLISAANVSENKIIRRCDRMCYDGTVLTGIDVVYNNILEVCVPFTIYRKEFLFSNNLKFMEGVFHEDTEFTPRAYYKLKRVSIFDKIIYSVYQNPNSITRSINPKKSFDLLLVASSLSDYCEFVSGKYVGFISRQIITCVNKALLGAKFMDNDQKRMFRIQIKKNKFLFKYFVQSKFFVFVIEGILCYLFAYRSDCIYHFFYKFFYPRNH